MQSIHVVYTTYFDYDCDYGYHAPSAGDVLLHQLPKFIRSCLGFMLNLNILNRVYIGGYLGIIEKKMETIII